jgi:PAS domain S-box-containing protein
MVRTSPRPSATTTTTRRRARKTPRNNEKRFRRYFQCGLIGMAITSPTKGILDVNNELCAILGYSRSELLQTTWARLTHPDDLQADLERFDQVLAGKIDGYSMDKRWIRKDGQVIDTTISVKCLRRADGAVDSFVALLQDVTERRRSEARLRATEERYRALLAQRTDQLDIILSSMPDNFWGVSHDWRFTYLNKHAQAQMRALGKNAEELVGKVVWEEFPNAPNEHTLRRVMSERIAMTDELYYPPLGQWVENHMFPTNDGGMATIQRDISERKFLEEERTQLMHRLLNAQEDERSRMSREVHDQLGQQLSTLILKFAALKQDCRGKPELLAHIESLEAIARRVDEDVDVLAWNLKPAALDDLGLFVALSNFLKSWSAQFGIHAELHTTSMERDRLDPGTETILYRVLQEALVNVAKHAGASHVEVLLERRSDHVSLIIEDDGQGFDDTSTSGAGHRRLGLVGMRERAALVGGTVVIESQPGQGTTVFARIPARLTAEGSSG